MFGDQAMTLAAIDRLVHHATILEMNVESYRRRAALDRKRGPGRPPTHATIKRQQKKLADLYDRHDHVFATGCRFKTRLPPFSSRLSRNRR